jgi:hypothetical protein
VQDLQELNLQAGTEGLQQTLDDVQIAARYARREASSQFGGDLDALKSAIDNFQTAIRNGRGDMTFAQWVRALGDDVGAVGDAYRQLSDDASKKLTDCDLSGY